MAGIVEDARRRRIADVVVIVAGVYALLIAMWSPPGFGPEAAERTASSHGLWWWTQAGGSALAVASVIVAIRAAGLAKMMAAAGGILLLSGLLAFSELSWLAVRSLLIPGLLILAASPFVGPMPSPEEEGMRRHGLGS